MCLTLNGGYLIPRSMGSIISKKLPGLCHPSILIVVTSVPIFLKAGDRLFTTGSDKWYYRVCTWVVNHESTYQFLHPMSS